MRPRRPVSASARPLNFTVRPHFLRVTTVSPLQTAFQQSRAQRNIDLVLPTLKATTLYVVVGSEPKEGQKPEWFLTESPTKGRFCVAASEIESALTRVPWPKLRVSGAQLLKGVTSWYRSHDCLRQRQRFHHQGAASLVSAGQMRPNNRWRGP